VSHEEGWVDGSSTTEACCEQSFRSLLGWAKARSSWQGCWKSNAKDVHGLTMLNLAGESHLAGVRDWRAAGWGTAQGQTGATGRNRPEGGELSVGELFKREEKGASRCDVSGLRGSVSWPSVP
jgi:hypothetical protein